MKFKIGRNNLAATFYVPYDCANKCPFCTSKEEYRKHKPDEKKVLAALKTLVKNPRIKDIVFTGGEPTANMDLLEEMVYIARNKNVYINTTLPSNNFFRFLELVNGGYVNGVNISRHSGSFTEDCKLFHGIVDDWAIDGISVPIKINAVLTEKTTMYDVKKIINRWKDKKNVTLCFRQDFRTTTFETLHTMSGNNTLDYLIENYTFESHGFCDVCDTVRFEEGIAYHRGMEHSSLKIGNTVIINDVIVFPDGFVAYDWDRKDISELDGFISIKEDKIVCDTITSSKRNKTTDKRKDTLESNHKKVSENMGSSCGVSVYCGLPVINENKCTSHCGFSSCGIDSVASGHCGFGGMCG